MRKEGRAAVDEKRMAAAVLCSNLSLSLSLSLLTNLHQLARPFPKQKQRVLEVLDELRLAGREHPPSLVGGGPQGSPGRRERRRALRDAEPATAAAAVGRFVACFPAKGFLFLLAAR